VFGTPLVVPAQFLAVPEDISSRFLSNPHSLSGSLTSSTSYPSFPQKIPSALLHASFVFVKAPPSHPPLSSPYQGPFKVIR
jgi:hypothetical protein